MGDERSRVALSQDPSMAFGVAVEPPLPGLLDQELAMKLGSDGQLCDPVIDDADEYCKLVYDLGSWVNPPED